MDEVERLAIQYAGAAFRIPRKVQTDALLVYAEEEWTPAEFLKVITDAINSIPDGAEDVKVSLEGDYEESSKFRISYWAMEPDHVVRKRVCDALSWARNAVERERRQYESLKKKFETSSQ